MTHHYSRKPNPGSGAMQSRVGNPQVYEDNDQKTSKKTKSPERFVHEMRQEIGDDMSHGLQDQSRYLPIPHPLIPINLWISLSHERACRRSYSSNNILTYFTLTTLPEEKRSSAKRLAASEKRMHEQDRVAKYNEPEDPRMPAWRNGREPSKGAKIDAQIMQEERE